MILAHGHRAGECSSFLLFIRKRIATLGYIPQMIVNVRLQGQSSLSGRIKETLWGMKNWLTDMCSALSLPLGMSLWFSSIQETSFENGQTPDSLMVRIDLQLQLGSVPLLDANEQWECLFRECALIYTYF